MTSLEGETELLRGICRVLILRIFEATSVRELLDQSVMKETKKHIPDIIENLLHSMQRSGPMFEDKFVTPIPVHHMDAFNGTVQICPTEELVRLAEIARFILEKEIYLITKKVIDNQS